MDYIKKFISHEVTHPVVLRTYRPRDPSSHTASRPGPLLQLLAGPKTYTLWTYDADRFFSIYEDIQECRDVFEMMLRMHGTADVSM